MDPAPTCCPHLECPARGHPGAGNIRLHARQEQRCLCTVCHKTFTATRGTVLYRLRLSSATVTRVVTLLAPGCPLQALGVAFELDERTGATGWARAGRQGQAVQEQLVEQPRALGQVQADEIRGKKPGAIGWMALAMRGKTRLGLAGAVSGHRDMPLIRRLLERVRRWATPRALWFCPAGLSAYLRAIRETLRDPGQGGKRGRPRVRPWRNVLIAPGVKRYERRRVVEVERRLVEGTPARVETLRRRAHGNGGGHTADLERRNAPLRARLAPLARRCRALARQTLTLEHGRSVMGAVSNFCSLPASLGNAPGSQTPAMAAGITEHCWTIHELLSLHVPPPRWTPPKRRGRPSHALKRLVEHWCS